MKVKIKNSLSVKVFLWIAGSCLLYTSAFTKKKIFHVLKMALFVVALSLILLSLLGTVAHATGLVDNTINAENLYSKYPLSNYQLDFYVDNSWSWLPWNWLDGIGKSVQYLSLIHIYDNNICICAGTEFQIVIWFSKSSVPHSETFFSSVGSTSFPDVYKRQEYYSV